MKIGILTSGGDTPGMNAVIRAIYIQSTNHNHSVVGIMYGWKGLIENIYVDISESIVDEIDLGGTILKSSRTNPFKIENGLKIIKQNISDNSFDAIIAIGGEDTLGVAFRLFEAGLPLVGVPKTIDNDLDATDYTFGFNTAISIATEAIDRLKTTAKSHDRVIVVEIMGRHAGWMTLHSGIAGGAHVILIPEYQISIDQICGIIKQRYEAGNKWAIVAVSEGYGFSQSSTENVLVDEFGHPLLEKLNIGKRIADSISEKISVPTRSIVLGHTQRGGSPSAYDRVLCSRLGLKSVELVLKQQFGMMPTLKGSSIDSASLQDAVARLKIVDQESWNDALKLMNLES